MRSSGRRPLVLVGSGFAIALLLVATNPSHERHRQAIGEAIAARRPLAGALGVGFLKSLVPDYHSWLVGSFTTHDRRLISAGMAGMVWVNDGALED